MRFTSPQIMRHPRSRERYYLFHLSLSRSAEFNVNVAKKKSSSNLSGDFKIALIHFLSLYLFPSFFCSLSGIFFPKKKIDIWEKSRRHEKLCPSASERGENRTIESDVRRLSAHIGPKMASAASTAGLKQQLWPRSSAPGRLIA